jgi:hypothetical protein
VDFQRSQRVLRAEEAVTSSLAGPAAMAG